MDSALSLAKLRFDQGTLVLDGVRRPEVERLWGGRTHPFRWDERIGGWRCEAIRYGVLRERLRAIETAPEDRVPSFPQIRFPRSQLVDLREEQRHAIEAWWERRRGVVVMPTGTGKTEVALQLMHRLHGSALVVAPVRDLMYQWHRRILAAFGLDAGVIGDNTFNVRPVSVTTYDSAAIHMNRLGNRFQLLIFDECHHLPGRFRRDAALMSVAPFRLGLTATPERSDGLDRDLEFLIGPTVYRLAIDQVRGKTLADFDVIRIPVSLRPQEQDRYNECSQVVRRYMYERRKLDPRFRWPDLCSEVGNDPAARQALLAYRFKQSIEDRALEKLRVIEDLFRLHVGEPILVFAGSNAMARDISIRFLIPCLLNHCGKRERAEILEGLAQGTYPALVANQVLDEGVDLPAVKVAIVVGGTASVRQAKQRLGRILRRHGNQRAVLYEVVCQDTNELQRSRKRRKSDAYSGTRYRRI